VPEPGPGEILVRVVAAGVTPTELLDASELKCFVDAVVPLNKASDAYCGRLEERKGRGKIVLSMEKLPARRVCEEWRFGPIRNINRTRPRQLSLLIIVLVLVLDRRPNPTANPWRENTHDKQERAAISVEDEFEFETIKSISRDSGDNHCSNRFPVAGGTPR
jgi:hypothetical protein